MTQYLNSYRHCGQMIWHDVWSCGSPYSVPIEVNRGRETMSAQQGYKTTMALKMVARGTCNAKKAAKHWGISLSTIYNARKRQRLREAEEAKAKGKK